MVLLMVEHVEYGRTLHPILVLALILFNFPGSVVVYLLFVFVAPSFLFFVLCLPFLFIFVSIGLSASSPFLRVDCLQVCFVFFSGRTLFSVSTPCVMIVFASSLRLLSPGKLKNVLIISPANLMRG